MRLDNHTFYKKSTLKYGITARGVHWNSKFSQYLRFEVLTKYLQDLQNSTILDTGCGFAEYLNFLKNKKIDFKKYTGIDCEEHMVQISKKRFKNYEFLLLDILKDDLPKADYYICSGAMNLLEFEDMKIFIQKCFDSSKKGFVFNFLKESSFTYVSQKEILSFCKTITTKIELEDTYLHNDCTIYLEK
ncbi:methyltransferase family protein [Malaciobacter marinus]|jgi:SAM-dependent methyltransferase|uniref:Methyltransferase family protein n=1 Tax=Malaciobacter marinus TaxID=505249 RepID=A0AB36ZWI6_9BACT|nr:class I SAM-dependent methyltransferase [Malaciobacter marinus]PPK61390.1 methyltransferase family protein [Malaciobacter marinus]SKB45828.1 Methyltransferase domain-containing protein [Malaciobacter marinus]